VSDAAEQTSGFNPFDPAFRADPHRWYRDLLAQSPGPIVVDGVPSLFVAQPQHITEVVRDLARFSSEKPKLPGMERVDFFNGMPVMPYVDQPLHTKLRMMAAPAFSPKALAQLKPAAIARIHQTLDRADAAGEVDFVKDIADPISREVLLDLLLSIPRDDWPVFLDIVHAQGDLARTPPGGEKPESFARAWRAGCDYCAGVIEEKRRNPSGDLASDLVGHSQALSTDELLAMLLLIFTGGLNTISTHLSCGLLLLLRHPDQAALLRADPALARQATEEILRYDAPNTVTWRFAACDTEVAGVPVTRQTPIYILNGAANFADERCEDPFRFDITRPARQHTSLGEGIHFCLGAPIARLVSQTVFGEMVRRFPAMALADPDFRPVYEGTPTVRRIVGIPLRLNG
jgi:cytochrome P450